MSKRLFLLFLDGADYAYVRAAMDAGLLPALRAVAGRGTFAPLATSTPAESPVAFAEILTGRNPGKHGIFDFLHRDPASRMPAVSLYRAKNGCFENALACPTVCEPLQSAGVKSALLRLPCTFPPPAGAGLVISGLGVPDITGTWGRAAAFSAAGDARSDLFGTADERYAIEDGRFILTLHNGRGGSASLAIKKNSQGYLCGEMPLPIGFFSPWLTVAFNDGARSVIAIHTSADDPPVFTITPLWAHPEDGALPAFAPESLGARLVKSSGLFPASGWPEPNYLFSEGRVDFSALRVMCERAAAALEKHAFEILSDRAYDFVALNYELFDRLAHAAMGAAPTDTMRAALMGALVRFDAFVREVTAAFPDAEILIASDHGFAPWTRRVNVNRFLAENGYLAADLGAASPTLDSLSAGGLLWQGVDWTRTRAYAVGLSKIYLNLEGREAGGIVPQGRPAEALRTEIVQKLLALRDGAPDRPVFRRVLDARRAYWGQAMGASGDLVLCYERGYRTDWVSSLGGAGTPVLSPNDSPWSADHCGTDPELIPGILLTSHRVEGARSLRDIAPTVLSFFGLPKDPDMDGTAFQVVGSP